MCLFVVALNCSEDQFGCVDSRGIVILCISKDWVCDRHKDCVDNSDEIDCDAPQGTWVPCSEVVIHCRRKAAEVIVYILSH